MVVGAITYFVVASGTEEPKLAAPATPAKAAQTSGGQAGGGKQPAVGSTARAKPGVMPTADNTGVTPGVKLKPSESLTITEDGATVEALDVKGCINVEASNVTIRNVRITANCNTPILIGEDVQNTLIEDIEINGSGNAAATAVAYSNYTLRRAYIHNIGDGPRLGDNTTVESSLVIDLARSEESHNDGLQSTGGSGMVVRGNYIENQFGQTSAILIGADQGDISDVLIEGNWVNGGGYTIQVGANEGFECTGVRVINNKFGRDFVEKAKLVIDGAGVEWSGNAFMDGEKIP